MAQRFARAIVLAQFECGWISQRIDLCWPELSQRGYTTSTPVLVRAAWLSPMVREVALHTSHFIGTHSFVGLLLTLARGNVLRRNSRMIGLSVKCDPV